MAENITKSGFGKEQGLDPLNRIWTSIISSILKLSRGMSNKFCVVIPTLGGDILARTIGMINAGTMVPDEILICIPKDFAHRVENLSVIPNVKVLATECKGQVKQRIEGFKKAENDFIIQLDDDMYVYDTCFERLIEGISGHDGDIAIGPAMIFEHDRSSCYDVTYPESWLNKMILGKNWFRPGGITRTGMNLGLNALKENSRFTPVEWLAGGCVVHMKKNLWLSDYYPFKGKAYHEDVIHSIHLRKSGVRLLVDKTALCGIDPYEIGSNEKVDPINIFNLSFRYRKYILKLNNQPVIYLLIDGAVTYFFTFVNILKTSVKYSFNIAKKKIIE